jgi:hypothetical protein
MTSSNFRLINWLRGELLQKTWDSQMHIILIFVEQIGDPRGYVLANEGRMKAYPICSLLISPNNGLFTVCMHEARPYCLVRPDPKCTENRPMKPHSGKIWAQFLAKSIPGPQGGIILVYRGMKMVSLCLLAVSQWYPVVYQWMATDRKFGGFALRSH